MVITVKRNKIRREMSVALDIKYKYSCLRDQDLQWVKREEE